MESKYDFLGLVVRANAYLVGDRLMHAIRKRNVHVVLVSQAISLRSAKQLRNACLSHGVTMIDGVPDYVFDGLFAQPIVAMGLTDLNMANKVVQEMRYG